MGYYRKWRPSKTRAREFAQKMDEVEAFCGENGIDHSASMDSFYFTLDGKDYRVSNHSVEASNRGVEQAMARDMAMFGYTDRQEYHPEGREEGVTYIHASKTRIIDIYNDLKAGYQLDGRGYRKGGAR